jgi:lipopolysaccharide heptosyltransferase II
LKPPSSILIVLLGAIGDVVRALPLLNRLRRAYPEARITWAAEPIAAPLLQNHPGLDEVVVFDRPAGAPAFLRFLRRVRALHPDLTIDLQRHLKSGVVSWTSRAPVRLGFDRQNSREGNWLFNTDAITPQNHFSSKLQQMLAFADWLGVPPSPVEFGLRTTDAEEREIDRLLGDLGRPFVAAFVGSSCESRLWFADRTARIAEAMAARRLATVLIGGPGDVGFAAAVQRAAGVRCVDLAGRTSLRHLIGIFRRARVAFGPDCGPMHIAAAVGTPVVSLWGATSAARSAPWASETGVITGGAPCSPCYLKRCPIGRLCMENIAVEAVLEKLALSLARENRGGTHFTA